MELSSTVKHLPLKDLSSDCNTLELSNGKATSLMGLADNQISTNSYLSNNIVLRVFFKLLNPCPLSLIMSIIIVVTIPHSEAYSKWMYTCELALVALLIIFKQYYFDKMRSKADQKINQSRFIMEDSKVFRDGEELSGLTWGQIQEGDILYLQKGQKAPADLLVLDTQYIEDREAIVYVDARSITGKVTVQRKKACYLTQVTSRSAVKRNWDRYRKEYLTGKLKYEQPNSNMEDFLGYLKLVKDPKTSLITFDNFISRESVIKTCWVYALVLNGGMNCKIMRHIGERSRNHRFFQNNIDRIFVVCIILNVILGLIFGLLSLGTGNPFLELLAYHLLEFSILLPHFLFLGNGLLLLYFSLKDNLEAQIINYSSITNLGNIDFAVLSYNGVLSSGKMNADQIITTTSLYDFREDNTDKEVRGSRRNGSRSGHSTKKGRPLMSIYNTTPIDMILNQTGAPQRNSSQYDSYFLDDETRPDPNKRINTGLHTSTISNFRMHLEPLRISKEKLRKNLSLEEAQAVELTKVFALCHQAILKSQDSHDIKFEANSKIYSEEVLLRLVNNIGVHVSCQIDPRTKIQSGLKLKLQQQLDGSGQQRQWFFSRSQNSFEPERNIYSVVVRQQGKDKRFIYCKGSPEFMLERLKDKQMRRSLIQKMVTFRQHKAQILVYGKRQLSKTEFETYENEYTKLKMSSSITVKELQDFSKQFEQDLDFVCMAGLSSQKNVDSKQIVNYLGQKQIKMCVFTNSLTEVTSLKSLLCDSNPLQQGNDYVELEGRAVEEITYNLNMITRRLNYEKHYSFCLVLGAQCWRLLKGQSSLMQHFLFAAYYSNNILTHGFTPQEKAQITEKLKRSYNRVHTLMSIGSSYSDLLFQNFSDVSLIISAGDSDRIHSDIPSDIRAPNIRSLKNILELGSWVSRAYSELVSISIYRVGLLGMVTFLLQTIVFAMHGTSFTLDNRLIFLYVVLYGILETVFVILMEQKQQKVTYTSQQLKDKKSNLKFWTSLLEGVIHGITITLVTIFTLPNARLPKGKLFPVETLHFSIYFLIISVSIFRHLMSQQFSKGSVLLLALLSYVLMLGSPWLVVLGQQSFMRLAMQMGTMWSSYDTVFMIFNAFTFCLASSLFISETRKKGLVNMLLEHVAKLKKQNTKRSKQLLEKDIPYVQLVKHLFVDEQNIQDSISELVGEEFDTNQLKINSLLDIKKPEHRIKNQFNNSSRNLGRFKIVLLIVILSFVADIIHGLVVRNIPIANSTSLIILIVFLGSALAWLARSGENLGRKYYKYAEISMVLLCLLVIIYQAVGFAVGQHFLLTCLILVILTQMMGIRLSVILILSGLSFLTASVVLIVGSSQSKQKIALQIILMAVCGVANIAILYSSTFDSRKNFILREQIQMQTNQTNDIWTILVPEFVRNFFAQNDRDGGQYKEKSVAILFCYVCNFDDIIEQEGRNVVRLLDNVYRQFDKICSSFAVQKIQTVGYTYMAATGIRKIENQMESFMAKRNKVERLMGMAQQMLQKTKLFKWGTQKNKDLDIKIGIHVGQVVVGVIGKHKKQFSLIGTNVNATSRHGSTGNKGSITISREARAELHNFPDESFSRKDVWMKGLCKTKEETIPVFSFKRNQANRRTNNSSLKLKFKKLVMKVIRSQRIDDEKDSSDEGNILAPYLQQEAEANSSEVIPRDVQPRITCTGLASNFNQIQQMKNRQDEIKCYSMLLQFSVEKAKSHFSQLYPALPDKIDILIKKEELIQEAYIQYLGKTMGLRDKLLLIGLFLLNLAMLLGNVLVGEHSPAQVGLRVTNFLFIGLLLVFTRFIHTHAFVSWIFVGIFLYLLTVEKIDEITSSTELSRSFSHFSTIMIFTVFCAISGMRFLHSLLMAILTLVFGFVEIGVLGILEVGLLYEWAYVLLVLVRKYVFQKESIINFRQGQKTVQISKQLSKIVSELLPKHAYEKLKAQNFQNRLQLTDMFEQCTILFADIKGFTQFSDRPQNREQPQNVVRMLRSLFEEFDLLCTENNVYKLYTIGDCYVVLGFTNCYDRNPKQQAGNVVNFAFEMIKMIDKVKRQKPELSCLNMRIGVHTGTIIGGIVGTDIVRYDIYGSDVVVANKFQQTGEVGKVHISEQTKKLLDQLEKKPYSENNIEPSERVQVKRFNVSYDGYLIKRGNLS